MTLVTLASFNTVTERTPATPAFFNSLLTTISTNFDRINGVASSRFQGLDGLGCTSGGTVNNYALIQASLNSLNALGGGTLVIPPGRWLVSSALSIFSNTAIIGFGPTSRLVFDWKLASAGQAFLINSNHTNSGNSSIVLKDFGIEGNDDGTPYGNATSPASGILLRRCTDFLIENLFITKTSGIAIALQGTPRGRVAKNNIYQCGRDGITGWWYAPGWNFTDVVIEGNTIHTVGDDGIAIHASQSDNTNTDTRPTRWSIKGNTIFGQAAFDANGAGRGITVDGASDGIIEGNIISDTFASGIQVIADSISSFRPSGIDVKNNKVTRAGQAGDGSQSQVGIRVVEADWVTIEGNTVRESAGIGIYTTEALFCPVTNNSVFSNGTLITHFGIDMDGTSSTKSVHFSPVQGNRVYQNAGGGIRMNYTQISSCNGNTVVNNGNVGNGSATNGSGIILNGDARWMCNDNFVRETRAGAARTQTHGIVVPNAGGSPTVEINNNDVTGHPGTPIRLTDNTSTIIATQTANFVSATPSSNFDQHFSTRQYWSYSGTPEGTASGNTASSLYRTDSTGSAIQYQKDSGTTTGSWRTVVAE